MIIIREPIDHITVNAPPDIMLEKITTALSKDNFKILKTDISERVITIRCIVNLFNIVLWQAWGEKVIMHFNPTPKNETDIQIYGVLNLLRFKFLKKERLYSKAEIAAELRKLIQTVAQDQ